MRFIARVTNLVRGLAARWIGRREHRHPEAVYEAAILARADQYAKLRQAAAGVLYMRSKLARQLEQESNELAHVGRQLDLAVDRDDDEAALALIARRDALVGERQRLETELGDLTREAEAAKDNLIAFQREIVRLQEERTRMLARLANAKARLRLQETLAGVTPDADVRALEEVRDHVERLAAEARVSRELGDSELERRLGLIREAEAENAARAQLEELKRTRREKLVPLPLPQAVPAAHP
jgi:phage shock protein A